METVLAAEFVEDEDFRSELAAIVAKIQQAEPERMQQMLVSIKISKGIKAKDLSQEGAVNQKMLVDVEAESLEFDNLTQQQDQLLENALQLPHNQQQRLLQLLQNHHHENRRTEIATDAQQTLTDFRAGKFRSQSAAEVITTLRQSLHETEEA